MQDSSLKSSQQAVMAFGPLCPPGLHRRGGKGWLGDVKGGEKFGHEQGPRKTFLTFDRLVLNLFDAPEPLVVSVWPKTPTFDKFAPE